MNIPLNKAAAYHAKIVTEVINDQNRAFAAKLQMRSVSPVDTGAFIKSWKGWKDGGAMRWHVTNDARQDTRPEHEYAHFIWTLAPMWKGGPRWQSKAGVKLDAGGQVLFDAQLLKINTELNRRL